MHFSKDKYSRLALLFMTTINLEIYTFTLFGFGVQNALCFLLNSESNFNCPAPNFVKLPEICLLVDLRGFLLHHVQELGEVDGPVAVNVHLHHQVQELVLGGVLAHGPHHLQ